MAFADTVPDAGGGDWWGSFGGIGYGGGGFGPGGGMDFSSFFPGDGGGGGGNSGFNLGGFTNVDPISGLPIESGGSGSNYAQPNLSTRAPLPPSTDPAMQLPDWVQILFGTGGSAGPTFGSDMPNTGGNFPGTNNNPIPPGYKVPTGLAAILKSLGGGGSALNSGVLDGIRNLISSGLGVYGAVNNTNQQNLDNQNRSDVAAFLRNQAGGASSSLGAVNGAVTPEIIRQFLTQGGAGQANQADISNRLGYLYNTIPGQFQTPTDASRVPGLSGAFDYLGGAQGANNAALQKAFALLNGGQPGMQQAQSRALDLSQGNSNLLNTGNGIVSSGGGTPLTDQVQQYGSSVLNNQGQTPQLLQLQQIAQQLMAAQHPELQAANMTASNLLSKNPLLPLNQVVSMATNSSATQQQNNLDTLRKQLLDRTGITGPSIASGNTNDLLSQLGDQALQAESAARQKALTDQQGLQLQQWQGAVPLINTAGNLQQGYTQQGLSTDLSAAAQAASREQALPALGISGGNSAIQRLLAGAGLINDNSSNSTAALNSFSNLFGTGASSQNNLLNSITSLLNNSGTLNQQRIDASMGLQKFGLDSTTQMQDAISKLLGLQNTQASSQMSNALGFGTQGNNLTTALLSFLSSNGGQQTNLYGNKYNISNPYQDLLTRGFL